MLSIYVHLMLLVGDVKRRGQRGLSQSTENVILLAGAVVVAGIVIAIVTKYIEDNLGNLGQP